MKFPFSSLVLIALFAAAEPPAQSADGAFTLLRDNDQLILARGSSLRLTLATHAEGSATATLSALEKLSLENTEALHIPIVLKDSARQTRLLSVLLIRNSSAAPWTIQREWVVAQSSDDKEASKDERQTLTSSAGALHRRVHRRNVESFEFTLPCGCCKALQTRTIETDEDETWASNAAGGALARSAYCKWYVVQPGEGLLAVARKALGDPRRLAHLYKLNPALKPNLALSEGQKILVESE